LIKMLRATLPCADPKCKDKMRLVFQNERFLGYRCLLKPNTHNFRYNIKCKKWEKIIISTKPIVGYKTTPYEILFDEEIAIETR
jgi:hypothetical protein